MASSVHLSHLLACISLPQAFLKDTAGCLRLLKNLGPKQPIPNLMQMYIPGPLGMIVAGIILRNVQNGQVIAGLKPSWSKEFRAIALSIIFLRSGLELDLGVSRSES